MNGRLAKTKTPQSGFTLVEVAIAVAIAGVALSTFVTMQTRLLDSYAYEQQLIKAVLYAQYLMTFTEVEGSDVELGSKEGELAGALKNRGYFEDDMDKEEKKSLEGWQYRLEVEKEDFNLGSILAQAGTEFKDKELARKISLTVAWGAGENEHYTLTYFIKPGT